LGLTPSTTKPELRRRRAAGAVAQVIGYNRIVDCRTVWQTQRATEFMSRDPEEERFARQDYRRYSGWSSAITIVATVIVLAIVFLIYQLK
jgi:hypothetical protein